MFVLSFIGFGCTDTATKEKQAQIAQLKADTEAEEQARIEAEQRAQAQQAQQQATNESFKNCTEMRKVYPSGVDSSHSAYENKHDRDKDGWACE